MSVDAKLKDYIDRVLRSREREDAEKLNTKQIYADLNSDGYDKAIVGKVVNHLRKDADKVREQSELFDTYLIAYLGASHVHARARDDENEDHPGGENANSVGKADASHASVKSTAVRKDAPNVEADTFPADHTHPQVVRQESGGRDAVTAGTQAPSVDTIPVPGNEAVEADGEATAASPSEPHQAETPNEAATEGAPVGPAETQAGDGNGLRLKGNATAKLDSAAGIPSIGPRESGSLAADAITQREDDASPLPSPTDHSEPASSPQEIAEPGDESAASPTTAALVVAGDRTKPNPWCMDPEECGVEASWNYTCLKCQAVKSGRERAGAALQ